MSELRRSPHFLSRAGFTLIEVLIAMALMAVISFGIYKTTTEAFRLREILMTEGEFHNGVRLAMNLVGRDIETLYSPTIMLPERRSRTTTPATPDETDPLGGLQGGNLAAQQEEALERQELEELAATGQDRPSQYWGGMISKLGIRPSRFVGTNTSMTLVSASHIRIYKDSREADLARISYEIKDDRTDREGGTKVLVKTENANAFDMEERLNRDKDSFVRTIPLLRGIESIKFEYYDQKTENWFNNWDTESQDHKNAYPDQVRITVRVKGPGRLQFEGVYTFRPQTPLGGLYGRF